MSDEGKILTKVTFKENCEYEQSSITKTLSIPQQEVVTDLTLTNITANLEKNYDKRHETIYMTNNLPNNYYTDILRFTASVHMPNKIDAPIQAGRIEFYWQAENSSVRQLLNKPTSESKTCLLNKQGQTAIDIQPKTSGTLYAQYIDDNDNYIANEVIYEIIMQDMPVTIEFSKVPPYIAHVNDEIEIEAIVKDINGDYLDYGLVTFLHYTIKDSDIDNPDKRIETPIGNPCIVKNGKATIKYIPVQTDDDTEPESLNEYETERYVEYIRAVYNYDSKGYYNKQWKYYKTKSTWTCIAIAKRNSLTIGVKNGNGQLDVNLEYTYLESQTESIKIYGYLHDKNNKNINLNDLTGINLRYYIKGTHAHPTTSPIYNEKQAFTYLEYYNEITDIEIIKESNDITAYAITLPHLIPGTYTITAVSDDVQHTISSTTDTSNVEYVNKGEQGISNDIYYEKIDDSNELLLNIEYDDIEYNIQVNNTQIKTNQIFTITGQIYIDNSIKSLLHNKEFYIYIPALQKSYKGIIFLSNNQLTFKSENININMSGVYDAQISIPSGIFSTNYLKENSHDKNIDFYIKHKIATCTIIVTEDVDIDLEIIFINNNNYAPCKVGYNITGKDITKETYVELSYKLKNSNNEPTIINNSIYLTKNNNTNSGQISELLNGGTYELIARAGNQDFITEFTITGDSLQQKIDTNTGAIEAGIYKTLGFYVWANTDITNIDINKISVYTQKNMDIDGSNAAPYEKNKANKCAIQSYKFIDKNTLYLSIYSRTYSAGTYYLNTTYEGDSILKPSDCGVTTFIAELNKPYIDIEKTTIDYATYSLQIYCYDDNGDKKYNYNEILLLPITFYKNSNIVAEGLFITDYRQNGILWSNTELGKESWWNEWDSLTVKFDPYNSTLINAAKNNFSRDDFDKIYDYVFDSEEIVDNQQPNGDIKGQVLSNENKYLYGTYQPSEITIKRPS